MPITSGAKKAHRASLNKRVFNIRRNRAVTDTVKKVRTLITTDKLTEAEALMPTAQKAIDKATKRYHQAQRRQPHQSAPRSCYQGGEGKISYRA